MERVDINAALIDQLIGFLRSIGLTIVEGDILEETVLPGIALEKNGLRVDRSRLSYPGDLLHEAGHLAVMTADERSLISGDLPPAAAAKKLGDEIVAIAWSYAALVHLGLEPQVLFHPDGYNGSSDWFIEQYTSGNFIGLPLLQWMGLSLDAKNAEAHGLLPYPHMIKWLRD